MWGEGADGWEPGEDAVLGPLFDTPVEDCVALDGCPLANVRDRCEHGLPSRDWAAGAV